MKTAAARVLLAAATAAGVVYVGQVIRGPAAVPSLTRDAAAGVLTVAAAAALGWASGHLQGRAAAGEVEQP